MTQAGMILGTAAYMAPEQARGRAVDKRADVWAFGAVLYEMLTGARAFPGDDLTDTLAAVVAGGAGLVAPAQRPPPDARRLPAALLAQGPEAARSRHGVDAPGARGRIRHGGTAGDGFDRGAPRPSLSGRGSRRRSPSGHSRSLRSHCGAGPRTSRHRRLA